MLTFSYCVGIDAATYVFFLSLVLFYFIFIFNSQRGYNPDLKKKKKRKKISAASSDIDELFCAANCKKNTLVVDTRQVFYFLFFFFAFAFPSSAFIYLFFNKII